LQLAAHGFNDFAERAAMAGALQYWSTLTWYRHPDEWVFANPKMHSNQPHWPAAKRVGIAKQIGWHSFRRSFATLLKGSGEDIKTVQELMRHANSRLTLDVYGVRTGVDVSEAGGALEGC
jgi:integrase